jgi:hypothetical protein
MSKRDYEKNLVRKPVPGSKGSFKGRQPPMTYMSPELVPGCPLTIDMSWVYSVPEPNSYPAEQTAAYDKIILNISGDPDCPEDLGAVLEYNLGGRKFTIKNGSAIYIPKGVKHGPMVWKKVSRPYLQMTIGITGKFESGVSHKPGDDNYGKYIITEPVYRENVHTRQGPLGPVLLYMCNDVLKGANLYIDYLWMFGIPEPHIFEHEHDFDEVVVHIGGNPDSPEDLGAEVKILVDGQPLVFTQTTALYIPRGVKHGPLTWNRVDRPHLQMPIVLGAATLDQAAPAGYKGDEPFFKNVK